MSGPPCGVHGGPDVGWVLGWSVSRRGADGGVDGVEPCVPFGDFGAGGELVFVDDERSVNLGECRGDHVLDLGSGEVAGAAATVAFVVVGPDHDRAVHARVHLLGERPGVRGAGRPVALVTGVLDPEVKRGVGERDVDTAVDEAFQEVGEPRVVVRARISQLGADQIVVGTRERGVRRRVHDELAHRLDRRGQQASLVVEGGVIRTLPVHIAEAVRLGVDRHPIRPAVFAAAASVLKLVWNVAHSSRSGAADRRCWCPHTSWP